MKENGHSAHSIKSAHAALAARDFREASRIAKAYLSIFDSIPTTLYRSAQEIAAISDAHLLNSQEGFIPEQYDSALQVLSIEPSRRLSEAQEKASVYIEKHFLEFAGWHIANHGGYSPSHEPYASFYKDHKGVALNPKANSPKDSDPLISILLPVYKVKTSFLISTLTSVIRQTYSKWELCIYSSYPRCLANSLILRLFSEFDSRILLKEGTMNHGISGNSNICLELASGEYIGLLDHDDDLELDALQSCVDCILQNPEADLIYTDKDCMLENGFDLVNPLLKPDWSPEIMYSANYLTHFNLLRRALVERLGGFKSSTDGAQDWDLFLRVSEQTRSIFSIKKICYHWRIHSRSTSTSLEAKPYASSGQLTAINDHLRRIYEGKAKAEPNSWGGFKVLFDNVYLSTKANLCIIYGDQSRCADLANKLCSIDGDGTCHHSITTISNARNEAELTEAIVNMAESGRLSGFTTVTLLSSTIEEVSPKDIDEICKWPAMQPAIAFCSGVLLDNNGKIIDSGLVYDEATNTYICPFKGCLPTDCGLFGSPLWYRNYKAARPYLLSISVFHIMRLIDYKTSCMQLDITSLSIPELLRHMSELGHSRGLVNPHAMLRMDMGRVSHDFHIAPSQNRRLLASSHDQFYHPYLSLSNPLSFLVSSTPCQNNLNDRVQHFAIKTSEYSRDAMALARIVDISPSQLNDNVQRPDLLNRDIHRRSACWFLPEFGSAFYGGIMTILRLADYLQEQDGIENIFLICGDVDIKAKADQIATTFPALGKARVIALSGDRFMDLIPESDYGIATLWSTAYVLASTTRCKCKYYMIQDYEPLFYPAGSTYAQADFSYRFGFYGIANTESLAEIYEQEYGGTAICLNPAVDTDIFFTEDLVSESIPIRIFYYCRPNTPRNCFELAAAAIRLIKDKYKSAVEILCAGSGWGPSDYGLDGYVEALGMLPYIETADLYRSCHIGLSMMMTKHPSYLPLEMMACGTLVVANHNEANSWLLKDGFNCLTFAPTRSCLFERLSYAIDNFQDLRTIRLNGVQTIVDNHSSWDQNMRRVADYIHSAGAYVK